MLRYIVSKIVEEIVKSPQNKRFFDGMPDGLKDAYKDHDKDGVINYLDKDVDVATRDQWSKGIREYTMGQGDFKQNAWDNSKTDSVYNKLDREVLSSGVGTYVRGFVFVAFVAYIVVSLILK
jgi:hypothetical protein